MLVGDLKSGSAQLWIENHLAIQLNVPFLHHKKGNAHMSSSWGHTMMFDEQSFDIGICLEKEYGTVFSQYTSKMNVKGDSLKT